jgi:hypothetical protein
MTMLARCRALALVTTVVAALGLAWASSRSWEAGEAGSNRPSITVHDGRNTADAAVVDKTPSLVRALTGHSPSKSRLPWELLATCGVAGIAAVVIWTRSNTTDRWSRVQLRLLRRTVALRGPPSGHLV